MIYRGGTKPGRTVRHYTDADRARAVGRTLAIGPLKASRELDIPVSTLALWRRQFPEGLSELADVSREAVAFELWQTFMESIALIKTMLRDPKARLGDVVRATEVLRDSHALLSGAATSRSETRTESMNLNVTVSAITPEERSEARRYVAQLRAQLGAGALDDVERAIAAQLDMESHLRALMAVLNISVEEAQSRLLAASEVVNILRERRGVGWSDGLG
jgi:transposase-like protein